VTARKYIVRGQVQGVGYRFFVVREARALDLSGYVRNLPDGTVEIVAEGTEEVLRELERRLSDGPPASIVQSVTPFSISLQGARGFTIR
jgi:acylphosphatase